MHALSLTALLIIIVFTQPLLAGQTPGEASLALGNALDQLDTLDPLNVADKCSYLPGPADAEIVTAIGKGITTAWYGNRTEIYGHGVLGDAIEAHTLYVKTNTMSATDCALHITLDAHAVFEDVNPRIADVTGDGYNDVIVIESNLDTGASLAIYGIENGHFQKLASTPHIGQSNRWLAPVGTADFNADGIEDVVFIETPHLGGDLQIWSFKDRLARKLAAQRGFSNHKIGENTMTGGIAQCGGPPIIVVPDRRWQTTMAATLTGGTIQAVEVENSVSGDVIARKLACD